MSPQQPGNREEVGLPLLKGALRGRTWRAQWLALLLTAFCAAAPLVGAAQTPHGEPDQTTIDALQWRTGLVKLLEGWREKEGDSLGWAGADFDDSAWKTVTLDELGPAQPGWRWYRLHVQLSQGYGPLRMLIAGGEGTYDLYINGEKSSGAEIRRISVTRPTEQVFDIPEGTENMVLAVRTYGSTTYTTWHLPLFLSAAVGTPQGIANDQASFESGRLYAAVPSIAINLAVILAGIRAFALYRSQRKRAEYRWLGFYLLLLGLSNLLLTCAVNGVLSLAWNNLGADPAEAGAGNIAGDGRIPSRGGILSGR